LMTFRCSGDNNWLDFWRPWLEQSNLSASDTIQSPSSQDGCSSCWCPLCLWLLHRFQNAGLCLCWYYSTYMPRHLPLPSIDVIWAGMIVWRISGKIIRTVQSHIVYYNCTVISTHISSSSSSRSPDGPLRSSVTSSNLRSPYCWHTYE